MHGKTTYIKSGQSIYDLAIQLYGNTEDVFKLIADNPDVFTQGLSTQLDPGTQIVVKQESITPRIQRFFQNTGREISSGNFANMNFADFSYDFSFDFVS